MLGYYYVGINKTFRCVGGCVSQKHRDHYLPKLRREGLGIKRADQPRLHKVYFLPVYIGREVSSRKIISVIRGRSRLRKRKT